MSKYLIVICLTIGFLSVSNAQTRICSLAGNEQKFLETLKNDIDIEVKKFESLKDLKIVQNSLKIAPSFLGNSSYSPLVNISGSFESENGTKFVIRSYWSNWEQWDFPLWIDYKAKNDGYDNEGNGINQKCTAKFRSGANTIQFVNLNSGVVTYQFDLTTEVLIY